METRAELGHRTWRLAGSRIFPHPWKEPGAAFLVFLRITLYFLIPSMFCGEYAVLWGLQVYILGTMLGFAGMLVMLGPLGCRWIRAGNPSRALLVIVMLFVLTALFLSEPPQHDPSLVPALLCTVPLLIIMGWLIHTRSRGISFPRRLFLLTLIYLGLCGEVLYGVYRMEQADLYYASRDRCSCTDPVK